VTNTGSAATPEMSKKSVFVPVKPDIRVPIVSSEWFFVAA